MTLKWVSAIGAAASMGVFATANVLSAGVPFAVNLALVATWAGGAILAVMAELYERLDIRLNAISDFLVTRFDEVSGHLEDLDGRTAEREPADVLPDRAVLPMAPRRNRPLTR
jgi:hypothetical protein